MQSKTNTLIVIAGALSVFFIAAYGLVKLKEAMPVYDVVKVETVIYEVVNVDPPKHYRVELLNTTNGRVVRQRSKHCSDWAKYPVGSQVVLEDVTYQQRNSDKVPFLSPADNWKSVICH